uniref:F-box domain-containing protein n=1 Tax=Parascaris univalens TaxID=6257 RepID=A0A915A0W8_PARUN
MGESAKNHNRVPQEGLDTVLERNTTTIHELRSKITAMQYRLAALKAENYRLTNHENQIKEGIPRIALPHEIVKMIFYECDALTRCRLLCTSRRIADELTVWNDVTFAWITRAPVVEDDRKTVMTHGYKVTTNCQVIGPFQVAKLIPMLNSLRNIRMLLIESSTLHFLDRCNRISREEGFFALLYNLECVKVCSTMDNLSLPYVLEDFLNLPRLRTLHIREHGIPKEMPLIDHIRAPIEDLRLCSQRIHARLLLQLCEALSKTLRRLELLFVAIIPEGTPTPNHRDECILRIISAIAKMENLSYVTLSRALLTPSIADDVCSRLGLLTSLEEIVFEAFDLNDLSRLVNVHLPLHAMQVTITDMVKVGTRWFPISRKGSELFDVFNDERIPILQEECQRVERTITLQFGRLRGLTSPTLCMKIGHVTVFGHKGVITMEKNPTEHEIECLYSFY